MYDIVLNRQSRLLPLLLLGLFLAGFGAGWYAARSGEGTEGPVKETRMGGYDFINPLLECDSAKESVGRDLLPFHYKVRSFIDEKKRSGWASHVSVYFREMNNGLSFNIHGQEKFKPASMIKVPLLIAYLKWAEARPGLLDRKIAFNGKSDLTATQTFKPEVNLERGKAYTIDDLLYRAIVHSDNNSYFLLYASIDPKVLHAVYTDLGLEIPKVRDRDDYMSVTEYASFFRMLYNASYLNREFSEKALHYLSDVDFKQGLVGGLPEGTVVAHKFGESMLGRSAEIKQLHDCGIVYYPNHPYLLCIMTRGESFEYLDDTLRGISRLVYREVDAQYKDR
jgi:hypothetical protein